jgi:predicted nucleic acid-binding protein
LILVDSSVWIDYFNGVAAPQTDKLDQLLGEELLMTGDLILIEVLQGFSHGADFERAYSLFASFECAQLAGAELAAQAARNLRKLRQLGITIRKTVDTVIATWRIENGLELLYRDRDFEPFVRYLGLRAE